MADNNTTTKQDATHKPDGKFAKGNKANSTGKGGFQDRPEDRSDGRWKKEESIPYLYNKFGRMSPEERAEIKPATTFEKIALARLRAAEDDKFGLPDTKEITDRVIGKAAQFIDVTTAGESVNAYASLSIEELRKLAGK